MKSWVAASMTWPVPVSARNAMMTTTALTATE
jgi:hypothetical protein